MLILTINNKQENKTALNIMEELLLIDPEKGSALGNFIVQLAEAISIFESAAYPLTPDEDEDEYTELADVFDEPDEE